MQVKDRLACAWTYIQDSSISVLDFALTRDLRGGDMTAPYDFGIVSLGFLQSSEMTLWNDEDVRRRLRVDVVKREDMVIFVDFLGRNLAANDAAEKTVWIGHSSFTCSKR